MICIVFNFKRNNYVVVVKIILNIIYLEISLESEYLYKFSGELLFLNFWFVCENRVICDICVLDFDNKVIVLFLSGDFCFSYIGILLVI